MVEALRSFAVMLVFCGAAGLLYYFLLPSGRISQTAKCVLSAAFLLCVLAPLFSLVGNELPDFSAAASAPSYSNGYVVQAAKEAVRDAVGSVVRSVTQEPYELIADMYITEDGGICIERVSIVFGARVPEPDALSEKLTAALGFTPELRTEEGP